MQQELPDPSRYRIRFNGSAFPSPLSLPANGARRTDMPSFLFIARISSSFGFPGTNGDRDNGIKSWGSPSGLIIPTAQKSDAMAVVHCLIYPGGSAAKTASAEFRCGCFYEVILHIPITLRQRDVGLINILEQPDVN
ncbi:hypothetical protein HNY73_017268 [Argiope bruennichi]|uniref:Uncharacterized protein n=1 Tax=Argiope bruennichi TaxID=94029 RepID=A0A8T0ERD3_ARGBR|nr:hypothetical protein HNY73_017268 [Argiope bruennichi]